MAPGEISPFAKTSVRVDRKKIAEAGNILGTETIVHTLDAALDEVINLERRRRVMDRIRRSKRGGIGPSPAELRRLRRP